MAQSNEWVDLGLSICGRWLCRDYALVRVVIYFYYVFAGIG